MDFTWFPYASGWTFPFFCLLFMAIMMLACFSIRFFRGRRGINCGCSRHGLTEDKLTSTTPE